MLELKILKLAIDLCFINQKYAKKAPHNRKGLRNIDSSSIGLTNLNTIFISENVTPTSSKLAFHCGKLEWDGQILKMYTRNGVVYIQYGRVYKILHIATLFNVFPDFDFGDGSLQPSY